MNSWEKFDETSLPDKEAFYSNLNIKGITDVDYRHAKRVFKEFNIKIQARVLTYMFKVIHHCFDVIRNFGNKCIERHKLDPVHFLSAPRLTWQACLNKTGVNQNY